MTKRDYYEVLGVQKNTSVADEIKKAFRRHAAIIKLTKGNTFATITSVIASLWSQDPARFYNFESSL